MHGPQVSLPFGDLKSKAKGDMFGRRKSGKAFLDRDLVLTPIERNNELKGSVGRRKADDLYVFQSCLTAGGEHIILGDLLLSFRVDDPKPSRTLHLLRHLADLSQGVG